MGTFSIRDYHAVGDGVTVDTEAFQNAIDACRAAGGGTVLVPPGRWLCGSLRLCSNMELHLEPGSVIICNLVPEDMKSDDGFSEKAAYYHFAAIDEENISVTGTGVIDGQGILTREEDDGISEYPLLPDFTLRANTFYFRGCNNISMKDVTLRDASLWTVRMIGCRHVDISGIKILNCLRGANNDGIDPDACCDVTIRGCYIEGGDDAIVVKTTKAATERYGPCEDILVTGCTLISRGSAVKIGTETWGDIRRVLFTNCIIKESNRGLGIWVRDGGTVEDIHVSDLLIETRMWGGANFREVTPDWWGKGEPLFFSAGYRYHGKPQYPGKIRRVRVSNITAKSENSIFMGGCPESSIENVLLENVVLRFDKRSNEQSGQFDEQPPELGNSVYRHNTPGVYMRRCKDCEIDGLRVDWGEKPEPEWSHLAELELCENIDLRRIYGKAAQPDLELIAANECEQISVDS